MQKRSGKNKRKDGNAQPQQGNEGEHGPGGGVQPFPFAAPDELRDQNLSARGKAHPQHGQGKDSLPGVLNSRDPVSAHIFTHDQHICHGVQDLQTVGKHKRKRKKKHPFEQRPLRKILYHFC